MTVAGELVAFSTIVSQWDMATRLWFGTKKRLLLRFLLWNQSDWAGIVGHVSFCIGPLP